MFPRVRVYPHGSRSRMCQKQQVDARKEFRTKKETKEDQTGRQNMFNT
jgi:hypothetical protein